MATPRRATLWRAAPRGVTLIEMMIVVTILAIMSAIAAPNLLPIVKKARLASEAEAVASFVFTARERAVGKNRCVRIRITSATQMVAEERTTGDCATAAIINNGEWKLQGTFRAEAGTTLLLAAADAASSCGSVTCAVIFRPSGRLRGDSDLANADDRVRIRVQQSQLTPAEKNVIINGSGRVCVVHQDSAPPAMNPATARNDCNLAIP